MVTSGIFRALFFDLDGTLVDTHQANFLAYSKAIGDVRGIEALSILKNYIAEGLNSKDFLPLVVPGVTREQVDSINLRKKEYYQEYASETTLNTYLVTLIQQMSESMTVGLVTTAKRANAEVILREHGIEDLFSFCIFGDDVMHTKPNPEAYLLALEKSGVLPEHAIAFEDSEKGIAAANAAGIRAVHIKDFSL